MGLSWLLLAISVGYQPTEFRLDTDSPDALCPELAMTRDAVRKRLGTLEVEGGGTWQGRYSTVHDPTGSRGDYVRLVIIDPTGAEKAVRELPTRGESCATVAQAIALVIDGFFRDLGQVAANDSAPMLSDHSAQTAAAAARRTQPEASAAVAARRTQPEASAGVANHVPVSNESKSTATAGEASRRDSAQVFGLTAGGGYESVPGSAAASLGLFGALTSSWRTDLRLAVPLSDQQHDLNRGEAHLRLFPLRTALTYEGTVWRELRLLAGPEVLVSFEHATTSRVEGGKSGWRAALGAGARGGAAYWILPRIALAVGFSAERVLLKSRRFLLEGDAELDASRTRLAGMFELWGVIFP